MVNEKDTISWWKRTVVYQIYPRSFMDSNGDGIGDLNGVISKLDYLKDLGIETIWFSPFYTSPQADFGYDISDYKNIAPEYGTMNNCIKLIEEIHSRGMKIVMDMVLNHTSDQHPWFKESRSSLDNPKRDWYIWKDGKKSNGKSPPNNWKARITGSGWHYDKKTNQWYWAQFLHFQPDLNYRNPEVKKTMFNIVRFWLKKGADGFRLDIFDSIYEDSEFRDNPLSWKLFPSDEGALFRSFKRTIHHPNNFIFVKELRKVIDEYRDPPRFLVGEVEGNYNKIRKYCDTDNRQICDGLHTVFLFDTLKSKFSAGEFRNLIKKFEKNFPDPFIPTWVFSNHDIIRRISALGNDKRKAKLNAALQLTVRGVPYIYYGEEIGMQQNSIPFDESLDAVSFKFKKFPKFLKSLLVKITKEAVHRDNCRTPMQWNGLENAGFCQKSVDPWLPVNNTYRKNNVKLQKGDQDSLFNCYKRFLKLRKGNPVINSGDLELIDELKLPKNVLGYIRKKNDQNNLYIFLNFNKKTISFKNMVKNPVLIESTTINTTALKKLLINLEPYEGIVIKEGE